MIALAAETLTGVEVAAELVRKARNAVVLTGAGLSTPSGIPDFRSEGTGLWARDEPLDVASLNTFRTAPERFFQWFRPLTAQILGAQPNAAHLALAALERAGRLHAVLTQNIDGLHHKAGSQHVVELHGSLRSLTCGQCFAHHDSFSYVEAFVADGSIPRCPLCGGVLKPDVILFGEQLPQRAWLEAQQESRACDLMIVIGSSLEVLPVAGLPLQAVDRGAHLIIVNQSPTYIDVRADVVLHEDVATVIPAVADRVLAA